MSPGLEILSDGRIKADPVTLETTLQGVFAGGDGVTGPKIAIDAIASGTGSRRVHKAIP